MQKTETIQVTASVTFRNSTDIPKWVGDRPYLRNEIVQIGGVVFQCLSWTWEEPCADSPDWIWLYTAMPYRRSTPYQDGALIYSTQSGAVWCYSEPSEEWVLFGMMDQQQRDELRTERLRAGKLQAE
jgi:hypothetical protein